MQIGRYKLYEEKLRNTILGSTSSNRNTWFKAAYYDYRTKRYARDIVETFGSNYDPIPHDAKEFLIKTRRQDIQTRWDIRQKFRQSKEEFQKITSEADKALSKARMHANRMEQRIKAQRTSFRNAKQQHRLEVANQEKPKISLTGNKSQEAARKNRKIAGRDHLEPNRIVSKTSNKTTKLFEGARAGKIFNRLANNRWLRRGVVGFATMFAMSKVMSTITGSDRRAIPEHYERGYDLINETLTDFGSPVKLWKTVSKTITPYKSSMRRGLRTSTRRIIESNPALDMAANAIKHHQF